MTAINFKFLKYGEKMFTQCISNEIIERIATCLHQFIIKKILHPYFDCNADSF